LKVLVTGGSEGIGLAIAAEAVAAGAEVEIWARREDKLRAAEKALGVTWQAVDVGDPAAVRAAAARTGVPDRLFHCAGFATAQFIDQVGDEDVAALVRTNVTGPIHVARAFAPAMRERRSGAIVLTASDLGYVGLFGWSVYSGTKHAVVGFASALRNELKPFGVSVQALCPPATQTPGYDKENETKPASVRKAEEAGGVMSAGAVAQYAWARCGRGGLYVIPNRTSRMLFAMSRVSMNLAHSFVKAPGPGQAR
jgi:3-dehydrosphinganine reductase